MYPRAVRTSNAFFTLLAVPSLLVLVGCDGSSETSGAGGSTGTATSTAGSGGGGGTTTTAPPEHLTPNVEFLPKATSECPVLAAGMVSVKPDGNARDVQIWMGDEAKAQEGPIVFFWHGAGGSPKDAVYALSQPVIDEIVAAGGIVAAPVHDPAAGQLPWFLSLGGTNEADLRVMDEVLACAIEQVGVDQRHIHSVGFSAGAMNTTQVGWRRSGYIASVVTFSGAQIGDSPDQDPTNLFPVMAFHGGASDVVIIKFQENTEKYVQGMKDAGHFGFICDHGKGHTVPSTGRVPAWQFLKDHPFGVQPEPYEKALPPGFPAYCTL